MSPLKNLFALNSNLSLFKDTIVQKNEEEEYGSYNKEWKALFSHMYSISTNIYYLN